MLFKELDRLNIADKSILINDAEAAYKVTCIDDIGILMTVGTGVIGIAKTNKGDFVRVAEKDMIKVILVVVIGLVKNCS